MRKRLSRICAITADRQEGDVVADAVRIALEAGIRCIQYRRKGGARRQFYRDAKMLRDLTRKFGALLIVNDFADAALAVDADGVHVGQDDLPLKETRRIMGGKIVGVSTHNLDEATEAEKGGADYIGFGPIFHTVTKDAGMPKGPDAIAEIKRFISIPIIAIGGIVPGNVTQVFSAGCDGVAISSGIFGGDITANIADLIYNSYRFKKIAEA
jgi:thiamine-phosphate pyrophosphorylase